MERASWAWLEVLARHRPGLRLPVLHPTGWANRNQSPQRGTQLFVEEQELIDSVDANGTRCASCICTCVSSHATYRNTAGYASDERQGVTSAPASAPPSASASVPQRLYRPLRHNQRRQLRHRQRLLRLLHHQPMCRHLCHHHFC